MHAIVDPMDRWITIVSTTIPRSDTELTLLQCNDDFAIRVSGLPGDLMNSRNLVDLGRPGIHESV